MMKSFVRLEKSQNYQEHVHQRHVNFGGLLLSGQNAQRFVERVFRVELLFVDN